MRFVISGAFMCLLPLSCADEGSDSDSGQPEGGGACLTEFAVLEPEEVRAGVSGEQVIAEYEGMRTSELQWVGTVSDGTIDFVEKGSATMITMTLEHDGGQIRFYEAGGTGAVGCAARFAVDVEVEVTTADGVLTVARPAELVRPAVSDEEIEQYDFYRAGIRLELEPAEDMAGLEVTTLSPEPTQPLRPMLDTGFRHDGSWDGSVTATLNVTSGGGLGTGHTIVFGQW